MYLIQLVSTKNCVSVVGEYFVILLTIEYKKVLSFQSAEYSRIFIIFLGNWMIGQDSNPKLNGAQFFESTIATILEE